MKGKKSVASSRLLRPIGIRERRRQSPIEAVSTHIRQWRRQSSMETNYTVKIVLSPSISYERKDIYGLYAEPVDPEDLPDYHDIIEHPTDFSTVRKKLANGSYPTLEELEVGDKFVSQAFI